MKPLMLWMVIALESSATANMVKYRNEWFSPDWWTAFSGVLVCLPLLYMAMPPSDTPRPSQEGK